MKEHVSYLGKKNYITIGMFMSQNGSVGIATGYGLDGRGLVPDRSKVFFSSP
jgi:hypothetical protein